MKRQNKGQIRIIEAFLAVLIVFSSFAISANLTVTRSTSKNSDLISAGLQSLILLDSDGDLGKCIDDRNWESLRDALSLALPAGTSFNLTIYDEQMLQVNEAIISNGAFSSQEVAFVNYVCVSRSPVFHCYQIYLYLAVAE
jgi:hypothetical protein